MAALRLNRVTKIYDKNIYGARDITFMVNDKEFAVLLGPSGCGKTTILRLIAGLEEITSGEIYIDNECVNNLPPNKRDIAMVFQNYALYPHMSVYDNIAFGLRMRRYPKEELDKRVKEAAEILEITELQNRKPRQLSGGQRQRVALGRAIVSQPKIFLFDEPLSNLDAKLRVQMRAELARLHKSLDATIVYVTHDQVEAMTLGEKIVVLKNGEVQQISDPITLYKHPKNRFVAGFIGSPPMNFINGFIKRWKNEITFQNQGFTLKLNKNFERFIDRKVVVGIRPNDFSNEDGIDIEILVDVIEPMGSEVFVYGKCGGTTLQAKIPERIRPGVGELLNLKINIDKIYLFDGETDESLK